MSAPHYPSNGKPASTAPPARFADAAAGSPEDDATTLVRIVLFLLVFGMAGFALLIGSIALDWGGGTSDRTDSGSHAAPGSGSHAAPGSGSQIAPGSGS